MKNKLLKISVFIAKFILTLDLILGILLVAFMIIWPIDNSFFDQIRMVNDGAIFKFNTSDTADGIPLSEYGSFYFYFLCIKAFLQCLFLFFILRTFLKIIQSISSLATFKMENVNSFQRIGKLFLVLFLFSVFSIIEDPAGQGVTLNVALNMKYALYGLVAFVLAEIFREGNNLMEDNKLTI